MFFYSQFDFSSPPTQDFFRFYDIPFKILLTNPPLKGSPKIPRHLFSCKT
ncbi:hypothetical protein N0824_01751 [Microcystis sp. 0824]|nr:hypothetical protein N0824_01751 [Microcystis sp. 0824]